MITNELRNIDIEKIRNPNMKFKKNPIHIDYVDNKEKVFEIFNINEDTQIVTGGHNKIYYNDIFTIRISKKIMNIHNEPNDDEKFLVIPEKNLDEDILKKALKNDLCPRVYLFSNIQIQDNIHRYCVMESYTTCMNRFIKHRTFSKILEKPNKCYENIHSIISTLSTQIHSLLKKTISMKIVYYDLKPDNIVMKIDDNTGELTLRLIDWDSDLCVDEYWIEENEDVIEFLGLMICGYFLYHYHDFNVLYDIVSKIYNETIMEKSIDLMFSKTTEYITVIVHYFYRPFGMSLHEKNTFDPKIPSSANFLKYKIKTTLLQGACKFKKIY